MRFVTEIDKVQLVRDLLFLQSKKNPLAEWTCNTLKGKNPSVLIQNPETKSPKKRKEKKNTTFYKDNVKEIERAYSLQEHQEHQPQP